jgi:hypothetical protein
LKKKKKKKVSRRFQLNGFLYIFPSSPLYLLFNGIWRALPYILWGGQIQKKIKDFLLVVCVGEMVVVVLVWWTRSVCARAGSIESTPSSPSIHFSQKERGGRYII